MDDVVSRHDALTQAGGGVRATRYVPRRVPLRGEPGARRSRAHRDTPTRAHARGIPSRATSRSRRRAVESTSRDRSRASRRPTTTRARHRASRRDVIPSRVDSSNSHPDQSCFTDDRPRVSFAVSSRSRTRASRRRRCVSIVPSSARSRRRPSVITNRVPQIPTLPRSRRPDRLTTTTFARARF